MDIKTLLDEAKTIVVVGCSPRASRTSHRIARYLQDAGYRVIPVNPHHDELLGERCYPDMLSIPADEPIDIVNVYRRPQFTEAVVEDTADWSERADRKPVIWTQIGVSSKEAQRRAEAAGLPYLANRCILVEHSRYL